METIPIKHSEELDGKEKGITQFCLGLPTVLRQILEQFPTQDLVQLSLVNKLWNFEARSVMRARGNVRANMYKKGGFGCLNPCEKLAAFASHIAKMQVVPFSGLHFPISHPSGCKSLSIEGFQPSYEVILERLHWKSLSVQIYEYPAYCSQCPALALAKQILEENCGVLEELILGFGSEELLGPIFQDLTLPCLKYLAIESWGLDSLTNNFIKALVSSAPNLQRLQIMGYSVELMLSILEGSSPKLTFRPLHRTITGDGFVESIRSDEMKMFVERDQIDFDLLNRFIPKLLEASRFRLKTFIMDLLFVLPLMCYGGICLENVTTLEMHLNNYWLEEVDPSILELLRGLDFTRVFPKLTQVRILNNMNFLCGHDFDYAPDLVDEFFEHGMAVLSTALPDRATNIKHLDLELCGAVEGSILVLLAQMFPDVKTVRTRKQHNGALLEDLREHFACLEEVIENEF